MPSTEYDAVRFILDAPGIAHRTQPYMGNDDFDFTGLAREAETMSGGEALLIRIAHELWQADKQIGLWEIVRRTDRTNFQRILTALAIARGLIAVEGLEQQLAA
jgi:hypothetical protein